MPYEVFPTPETRDFNRSGPTDPSLAIRVRTRFRRAELDRALATGVDPGDGAELTLRAEQLGTPAERGRIALALVKALGDEPMTLWPRPHRAAVRDAADNILALVLRLRDDRPVGIAGVAAAARLVGDRRGPMYRDDAGDLHHAIRSALSALDATAKPAEDLEARAA